MDQQNQNPSPDIPDDGGDPEGSITMSLAQYNRELAAARRTGERRGARAGDSGGVGGGGVGGSGAAGGGGGGGGGGGSRLDRIEGALERLSGLLAQGGAPAGAAAQGAGAQAAASAPTATPVAAAPAAPVRHDLPTNAGIVDIWNLKPEQLDQLGPAGVRAEFEKHLQLGHKQMGAPPVPKLPSR